MSVATYDRIFTIHISATEAKRKVSHWLAWEVAMTLMGQNPSLVIGERIVWRVPVVFTAVHVGVVGMVGEIDVDVESGEMIRPEGVEEAMLCAAKKLAKGLPPFKLRELPAGYQAASELSFSDTEPTGDPAEIIASFQQHPR